MRRIVPVSVFALLMFLFPRIALEGAREGLTLWFQNVLPAQFPFMVCVLFLMKSGLGTGRAGTASVFLIGILSGYPGGAKAAEVLYREGRLSPARLRWLMSFCNNSGPLFMVGTVGIGIFGSAAIGYWMLAAHLLAALVCGLLFSMAGRGEAFQLRNQKAEMERRPFGAVLGECVSESASLMITIGGFMMLYCVLIHLGEWIWPGGGYLYALLEMTNGTARLSTLPLRWAVPLSGALISMGGLSVYSQVCAVLYKTSFSGTWYLAAKCAQGLLCGTLLYLVGISLGWG